MTDKVEIKAESYVALNINEQTFHLSREEATDIIDKLTKALGLPVGAKMTLSDASEAFRKSIRPFGEIGGLARCDTSLLSPGWTQSELA